MKTLPTNNATWKDSLKFLGVAASIIGLGLWVQSDQFKMLLGIAAPIVVVVAVLAILIWVQVSKNETAILVVAMFALGALGALYQETHAFRDALAWHQWLFIVFILSALKDAAQIIIANGIAAGIAKAKAAELKALTPPLPLEPIKGAGVWAGMKRAYREASAPSKKL